jgi:hypothetical protein
MTENGRLKINPLLAWGIITYLLAIGVGIGTTLAQVNALQADVHELKTTRSRSENDEIIKRLDSEITDLRQHVERLEVRR